MQIAICDDDRGCCAQIEKWIINYGNKEKIDINIDIFFGAEVLINRIKDNYYFDMIFLDIELPERTGIELGYEIRKCLDEKVSIIFISGKTKYCQQLFDLEPQNFYEKPLKEDLIIKEIDKVVRRNSIHKKTLKYTKDGISKGIPLGKILYIEAKEKLVVVTTIANEEIIIRDSIERLAKDFFEYKFCRCHRSFLVNLFYVKKYYKYELFMANGKIIPVGRKYSERIKKVWAKYEEGNL